MRVGIFGDSFATHGKHGISEIGESWVSLLEKTPGLDVTANGQMADNIYGTYSNILENYHHFDTIIFVITSPERAITSFRKLASYPMMEHVLKTEKFTREQKDIIKSIKDYHFYALQDSAVYNQLIESNKLMIEKVRRIITNSRRNLILVPAFEASKKVCKDLKGISLSCVTEYEDLNTDIKKSSKKGYDLRHCHMSEENNRIFYDYIMSILKTPGVQTTNLNLDMFVIPDSVEKYAT